MTEMIFKNIVRATTEEKRSRFIGIGLPCHTLAEFSTVFAELKAEFADATHIAYAYRIREGETLRVRAHDANEPSGTAGKPILNHLNGHDLMSSAILVVRYFGGIKLGAGGLSRAYGACAGAIIQAATLVPLIIRDELILLIAYDQQSIIERLLTELNADILERTYTDVITFRLALPREAMPRLAHLNVVKVTP